MINLNYHFTFIFYFSKKPIFALIINPITPKIKEV